MVWPSSIKLSLVDVLHVGYVFGNLHFSSSPLRAHFRVNSKEVILVIYSTEVNVFHSGVLAIAITRRVEG